MASSFLQRERMRLRAAKAVLAGLGRCAMLTVKQVMPRKRRSADPRRDSFARPHALVFSPIGSTVSPRAAIPQFEVLLTQIHVGRGRGDKAVEGCRRQYGDKSKSCPIPRASRRSLSG